MIDKAYKKVSVIVPNYNYGKYIEKRLKSILSQIYPVYEIIVLDDASTDGSAEIAKNKVLDLKLAHPKMKIKFVGNVKNSGKAISQWKKGIEMATGDYIWIAEADDLSSKKFLKEVMEGFNDPEVVLSYMESTIINNIGVMIAPNFKWSRDKEKTGHYARSYVKDGRQEIEEIMAIRCTIPNVSAVVIRNDKKYLKYLEEALQFSQVGDWYFYVKVLESGKISYKSKALNKFRVHRRSKTAGSKKNGEHYKEILQMHEYFRKNYKLSKQTLVAMEREEVRVKTKHGIMEK